jgi:2-phospho-L-lactate guanylyltransferase
VSTRAVLIPIKAFDAAKGRLAEALDGRERSALARSLAAGVIAACAPVQAVVVCEDGEVAEWATAHGARVITNPRPGLNQAVRHGIKVLAAEGVDRVLVTHADLAEPGALTSLFDHPGIVLAPDDRLDGTNAMVIPTTAGFSVRYGPRSFALHLSEAERLDDDVTVVTDLGLGLDIDHPADLDRLRAHRST